MPPQPILPVAPIADNVVAVQSAPAENVSLSIEEERVEKKPQAAAVSEVVEPPKVKPPHDPEKIAENRLYLAENAITNGGTEQARKLLTEVIEHYPQTRAVVKARELLAKLPPAKK